MSDHEDRDAFLREAHVAVLATVGAQGRPHAVPIWYVYEEGTFIMSAGGRSQKARNIARNPEVTLVIDRRTLPYYAVMASGAAELGPPPSEELMQRLAVRYLGEARARAYLARPRGNDGVTIRLRPRRFVEYHGVSGREQTR